jgi:hypothetical protein
MSEAAAQGGEQPEPPPPQSPPEPQFMLHAVAVPGDGDCLFSSVALVLLDWLDGTAGRPRTPTASSEVRDVARYLRTLVASRVLDRTDEESERMIETWRRLWGDACRELAEQQQQQQQQQPCAPPPILHELQHLDESISPAESGPLPLAQRRALYRNMMDARRYWGDEFALRTLETALGGRFCVVDERLNVVKRERNESARVSSLCRVPGDILPSDRGPFLGVLLLRHAHYEPAASDEGQMAWDMRNLPVQLQRIVNYLQG